MWRKLFGMPRSDITTVTGAAPRAATSRSPNYCPRCDRPVHGSRLIAWLRSGKRSGSRKRTRRVVADDVPVAFFGVELQRSAAISRSASAAPRSPATVEKPREHRVCLPDRAEDLRLRKARVVVCHVKVAVCAPALCVHAALGDHFAVRNAASFRAARCPAIAQDHAGRRS